MMPHDYPTRVLLAVTGLTPQIVTETLYALAVDPDPPQPLFTPTQIRLITTKEGARRAKCALLDRDHGWFHRLRSDHRLPEIDFAPEHIVVVKDRTGHPLEDIRSREDNRRAADTITAVIRELSRDDGSALHVSIAGGRKTMGFYVGYALSLYGRAQDRLSHVLVNAPFESHQGFFYPPPTSHIVRVHTDGRSYDARDARVTLADIPFVRLREALGRDLLGGSASFSAVVEEAQRAVPPVGLVLDPETGTVTAGGETMQLKPSRFALYWMLAERALRGRPAAHWSEDGFMKKLLDYYGRVENPYSGDYERVERAYQLGNPRYIVAPAKSHINRELRERLGERRAAPYLIHSLDTISGTSRKKRFGLRLQPSTIRIRPDTHRDTNAATDAYATGHDAPRLRPDSSCTPSRKRRNGGNDT